ncbi:hypothetical protein KR084_011138 [Drosophila pseudotakahashii]|nr:hypothetical protein KR084_011138 [Drosophila pseudotakahashii]
MAPSQRSVQALESRRTRGTQSYRCRVCRGIHPLKRCQRFQKLSAEKCLRAMLMNKYCANYLAHEHSQGIWWWRVCNRSNHTLLMTQPANSQRRSATQRRSTTTLPTAMVILKAGLKTFDTAALIDPCTPTSCIDASLSSAFRLPRTSVGDEKVCTATVRSKVNEGTKLEVILKVEQNVRIRTPIRAIPVVEKFKDLPLADKSFYLPATISLMLGGDVYSQVIQPGMMCIVYSSQKSTFSWILYGACNQGQ